MMKGITNGTKLFRAVLALMVVLLTLSTGCGVSKDSAKEPVKEAAGSPRFKVFTSIYPVYEFAKNVAGDKADVVMFVPPGKEPHDWEPSLKEIAQLREGLLFIYNGAGFEPWVEKILKNLEAPNLTVVEATKGLSLMNDVDKHAIDKHDGQKHDDDNHDLDPHVWLDPVMAQEQVKAIESAFIKVDAANKDYYMARSKDYRETLAVLDKEFNVALGKCEKKEFVVSHSAFGYLAKRYGLHQIAVMGLSPDAEPKPGELAEVVQKAKKAKTKYIFVENLVSPKVAEVVAKEIGAQTLVLNPLEGLTKEEVAQGKTYISVMRDNLAQLKKALDCQ